MKKMLCTLLSLLLLLSLAGCKEPEDPVKDPVSFYYLQSEMKYGNAPSVIEKEVRDAGGRQDDYAHLIALYLKGPENYALYRPFPKKTALEKLELQDGTAYIQLSAPFAALTGMNLSLACACITMTVCEMTGMSQASISVPGMMLDGNQYITMSAENLLLMDDSNVIIEPN